LEVVSHSWKKNMFRTKWLDYVVHLKSKLLPN
jgi:hypothetical protein